MEAERRDDREYRSRGCGRAQEEQGSSSKEVVTANLPAVSGGLFCGQCFSRDTMLRLIHSENLEYQELIAV